MAAARVLSPAAGSLETLLTVILVISAVEAAQTLLLVGTCDIDDLILNTAGAAIGYGLYRCFSSVSR